MDWVPAITTTSLFGVVVIFVGWLSKKALLSWVTGAVSHDFDQKLERVKADLRKKEAQIDALRSGALSGVQHRQSALYDRRLQAIEDLWSSVISLTGAKHLCQLMAIVKFDVAAEEAAKNSKFREVFKAFGAGVDLKKMDLKSAQKSRPFVSPPVWAFYQAYQSIISQAVIQMETLKHGVGKDLTKSDELVKLVAVTLPHQKGYIENYGIAGCYYLLDEIEQKLLVEIDKMLNGAEADRESLETAANIIKVAEALAAVNAEEARQYSQP